MSDREILAEAHEMAEMCRAAEERGRRAGIEERDQLRKALIEVQANHVAALGRNSCYRCGATMPCPTRRIVDAALAPRDSGTKPEDVPCSSCDSIRGTHASWCHLYPFATNNPNRVAPRLAEENRDVLDVEREP